MALNLFTIAPHVPFLHTLGARILDGTLPSGRGRFALADLTIYVPTRRARAALADVFVQMCGPATLLPDLRTLGETDEEEEPFLPPFPAPPLPPQVAPQRRKLILAQLIAQWISTRERAPFAPPGASGFQSPPNAREILGLADSLAELIDDCEVEDVPFSAISGLDMGDLASNWEESLAFLRIALEAWPQICGENGEIDAARARNERLKRQSDAIPLVFADRPVIVAGSTGSIPATARLLSAVASLARGAVVLPGMDTSLTPKDHHDLLDDRAVPHGHPQHGLMRLLRRLGTGPQAVTELARPEQNPRTTALREALALEARTAEWASARQSLGLERMGTALNDIAIMGARTDEEQARAIAVAARQALSGGKSVGIITPSRTLARRIAAELARFDVHVDDSAGTPLYQSAFGRLARQALRVVENNWAAVDLMALLRNRAVHLGFDDKELAADADLLEMALLRGQRPPEGPNGLREMVRRNEEGQLERVHRRLDKAGSVRVCALITAIENALAPIAELGASGRAKAADLARAVAASCARLTLGTTAEETVPGAPEFARWADELARHSGLGPDIFVRDWSSALYALMAGITVRPPVPARADISILGLIEARLLTHDLSVVCGLNEGVWPDAADPGPWLSRGMALQAGLAPPERRHGQMAHDFAMAAGSGETLLCYSERVAGSPADPSRLLQRLVGFAGPELAETLHRRGDALIEQARRLDIAQHTQAASAPSPRPPAKLRPRRLSVTEVEKLVRSPYDIYARHVLRLRPLEPLGDDPDFAERGTLIHDVLARFFAAGGDPSAPDALSVMMQEADAVFAALETSPSRRASWRRRFASQAAALLNFEKARQPRVAARHVERWGRMVFEVAGCEFTVHGRADRIDVMTNGKLEILDYKTGGVPDNKTMGALLAPQLPIEAQMARLGAFEDLPPADVGGLIYLKMNFGPKALEVKPFSPPKDMELGDAISRTFSLLQTHIDAYLLRDDLAMLAHVFPDPNARFGGDYDHLARLEEWALVTEGEEGA